ncbi:energy transducer TonB [uncultured Maricaulis sp.]|uniref:energy transducer TonB n=1 Tax=uncultured Maricaulis sp. TaxID=174710 RepID=UPI0030DC5912|tara:strand:- start:82382 stop:83512 length:1131 start_codon:yes stop_codon:yes gene_type:complete
MTRIGVVLGCFLALTAGVMAQDEPLPDSVAQPYLAYEAAMAAQDYATASEAAETAWRAARAERIDSELIGILAENYGQLALARGQYEPAYDAWRSAAEISDRLRAPAAERALRWYQASLAAFAQGDTSDAFRCSTRSDNAVGTGEVLADQGLSGDIHYMIAATAAQLGRIRLVGPHAVQAVAAYEAVDRPHDYVLGNAYYLSGVGRYIAEERAASILDFRMAANILGALEQPESVSAARTAWAWATLAGYDLDESQREALNLQIAASEFPNIERDQPPARIDDGNFDTAPLRRAEPLYPVNAAEQGLEGVVLVQFAVNEDGRIEDAEVLASLPRGVFDRAAMRAIERWHYRPAVRDGVPVRREALQTQFQFMLSEE